MQSATLAEQAGAAPELVCAALLQDLGHLLNPQGETPSARGVDDTHQYFAIPYLRGLCSPAVLEPIRLYVDAKRYLCATDAVRLRLWDDQTKVDVMVTPGLPHFVEVMSVCALASA